MQDFEGKIAVVTGGASGIGEVIARTFAAEGMHVVVSDIEIEAAEEVSRSLRDTGVKSIAIETDVSDGLSVEALAEKTFAEFGAAHLVCDNAGVCVSASAHESSDQDRQWLFRVNVDGVIHGCQAAFVTTNLIDAERNRPKELGERPGNLEPILGEGFEEGMPELRRRVDIGGGDHRPAVRPQPAPDSVAQSRADRERCLRGTGGVVTRVRGLPRACRVASLEPAVGRRRQCRRVPSI